jgi:arsenate reductase
MKQDILFLCTGNSCRSQMAEGFVRHYAGDRFNVYSAGLRPRPVHPLAIEVMKEAGIDISSQRSKAVGEVLGKVSFRYAIFVCHEAEQNCPTIYPFSLERLSWPFDDPTAFDGTDLQKQMFFRRIRDQIGERIENWLSELEREEWDKINGGD